MEVAVGLRYGKTTRMLETAVAAAREGPVAILAHSYAYAKELAVRAREMAYKEGISSSNITGAVASKSDFYWRRLMRGRPLSTQIFVDHYVWESL